MAYVRVYQTRINWENLPSMKTPLNEYNLNRLDYAANIFDAAIDELFVTKAEQADLLVTPHTIDYDPQTGQLLITFWNGSTQTIYLNTGSSVSISDLLSTGQKIATITIDGVDNDVYAPSPETGSTVTFTRSLSSGTKIGTITIDGTATDIYCETNTDHRDFTCGTKNSQSNDVLEFVWS